MPNSTSVYGTVHFTKLKCLHCAFTHCVAGESNNANNGQQQFLSMKTQTGNWFALLGWISFLLDCQNTFANWQQHEDRRRSLMLIVEVIDG